VTGRTQVEHELQVLLSIAYINSLSRETLSTRKDLWNVYCFATNQMQDKTANGNRRTATWIIHDLTRKQRAGFFFHDKLLSHD